MEELIKLFKDLIGEAKTRTSNKLLSTAVIFALLYNWYPIARFAFSDKSTMQVTLFWFQINQNIYSWKFFAWLALYIPAYTIALPLIGQWIGVIRWEKWENKLSSRETAAFETKAKNRTKVVLALNHAKTIDDLGEKIRSLEGKLTEAEESRVHEDNQFKKLSKELTDKTNELDVATQEIQRLEKAFSEEESIRQKREQELLEYETTMKSSTEEIFLIKNQITTYRNEMSEFGKRTETLLQENTKLRDIINEQRNKLSQSEDAHRKLSEQQVEHLIELQKIKAEAEEAKANFEIQAEEISSRTKALLVDMLKSTTSNDDLRSQIPNLIDGIDISTIDRNMLLEVAQQLRYFDKNGIPSGAELTLETTDDKLMRLNKVLNNLRDQSELKDTDYILDIAKLKANLQELTTQYRLFGINDGFYENLSTLGSKIHELEFAAAIHKSKHKRGDKGGKIIQL
ncbi:MAG: hypothetical protein IPO40_12670 [Fibrobacteres bacterium]|nr:hypothetical protein [Fibrobacterota bacterium]